MLKMPHDNRKLPVHIVEQHNDVVPFIHRAVASKRLPFSEIPIIHLDSHPDLLLPIHLDADSVFKPQELYEALSIENWLLPLLFAKHIDHVVWVKPPWANQIKASSSSFFIGKCCQTGKVRLSCKENYFLTDGLFCTPCKMTEKSECKLTVVELCPSDWKSLDSGHTQQEMLSKANIAGSHSSAVESPAEANGDNQLTSGTKFDFTDNGENTQDVAEKVLLNFEKWREHVQDIVKSKPYILDIDLDFFSTQNPFKDMFESVQEAIRRLFAYPLTMTGTSNEEVEQFTCKRQEQLRHLETVFNALDSKWCEGEAKTLPLLDQLSTMSLADLTRMESSQLQYFCPEEQKDMKTIIVNLLPCTKQNELTFSQVYDFGCTLDDTDLPHHVSTDAEIEALVSCLTSVLVNLPKPTVVTISRSSHDDYCPKSQVEKIQAMILKLLNQVYGSLDVTKNFDE